MTAAQAKKLWVGDQVAKGKFTGIVVAKDALAIWVRWDLNPEDNEYIPYQHVGSIKKVTP